jgi:hypothetical protein
MIPSAPSIAFRSNQMNFVVPRVPATDHRPVVE